MGRVAGVVEEAEEGEGEAGVVAVEDEGGSA